MEQAPSTASILLQIIGILVSGACTIVATLYGFKAAVREFRVTLDGALKTKIDLSEYRASQGDMHGKLNRANEINAVQDNEIRHLQLAVIGQVTRPLTEDDPTPPLGTRKA